MAGKNVDIFLNLDLGQSLAKAQQIIDAQKAIAREALNAGKAQEKAQAEAAAGAERATAAFTAMAVSGATMIARELASSFGQAVTAAEQKMKAVSDKFSGTRDSLRELANLRGEPLDASFMKEFARFNVATGLRRDESVSLQTQILNSGAQYIGPEAGKKMGVAESKQFAEQVGLLAGARGMSTDVIGDLAGRALGLTDYKKFGTRGSEEALGRLNAPLAILDAGVGKSSVLGNQLSMLMGTAYSEDEARGAFTDAEEMAMVLSVQAQKSPGRAFTGVRAAMKGIRDFDNPLVKKAGIGPMTKFTDAMRMLAPVIQQEATEKGIKPLDVVRGAFKDTLTSEGITTQTEEGVNQGLYAQRAEVGRLNRGQENAMAKIDAYRASAAFRDREADARNESVDITKGIRFADVNVLRKQSTAQMRLQDKIDTTTSEWQKYLLGTVGFGAVPDRDKTMVDTNILSMLAGRGARDIPQTMTSDGPQFFYPSEAGATPEGRQDYLNRKIGEMRRAGLDPFHDPMPTAIPSEPNRDERMR